MFQGQVSPQRWKISKETKTARTNQVSLLRVVTDLGSAAKVLPSLQNEAVSSMKIGRRETQYDVIGHQCLTGLGVPLSCLPVQIKQQEQRILKVMHPQKGSVTVSAHMWWVSEDPSKMSHAKSIKQCQRLCGEARDD